MKNIRAWESDDPRWPAGCTEIRANSHLVNQLDEQVRSLAEQQGGIAPTTDVMSKFTHIDSCTGAEQVSYIEPLVSFLRQPDFYCLTNETVVDKSWIVLPNSAIRQAGRVFFFDVGASLFNSGYGGASQEWFYYEFLRRGFKFDRILGWEANAYSPSELWSVVPPDVKLITQYFNIPATTDPQSGDNPLRYIRALCSPEDYVILKIDIDHTPTEVKLIRQLLADHELLSLVDELFWEHHVRGSPMQWGWWGDLTKMTGPDAFLHDTYDILSRFRKAGIRAHSWV